VASITWRVDCYSGGWGNRLLGKAGTEVGCIEPTGYRTTAIAGARFKIHRICWKIHYGTEPPPVLDHKDQNQLNNRIENLRAATTSLNGANRKLSQHNRSGCSGVCWVGSRQRWSAYIKVNGARKTIGWFADKDAAVAARIKAAAELFGVFTPRSTPAKEAA
jgi:hypothetical protein